MSGWNCGILGCGARFERPRELILHQADGHEECTCAICGERLPAGFLAIHHAFSEHNRAEFVRSYGASADHVRRRESVIEDIEERVDLPSILSQLDRAKNRVAASND